VPVSFLSFSTIMYDQHYSVNNNYMYTRHQLRSSANVTSYIQSAINPTDYFEEIQMKRGNEMTLPRNARISDSRIYLLRTHYTYKKISFDRIYIHIYRDNAGSLTPPSGFYKSIARLQKNWKTEKLWEKKLRYMIFSKYSSSLYSLLFGV